MRPMGLGRKFPQIGNLPMVARSNLTLPHDPEAMTIVAIQPILEKRFGRKITFMQDCMSG